MSDTPKFTVIDRRKLKAEQEEHPTEQAATQAPPPPAEAAPSGPPAGPRLVVSEPKPEAAPAAEATETEEHLELPPAPTAQESQAQKTAYDASAQRLEDLIRAQNPAMGAQPPIGFEHLVQQLYLSAMIQMGAGGQEGQRPRIDILGARQTIDTLSLLADKTKGNLTPTEETFLQNSLYEVRMAYVEVTNALSRPPQPGAATGTAGR